MQNKSDNSIVRGKYDKLFNYLFFAILLIGLALRFHVHFMGRPLWDDETHFALNFIKYDFMRLTKPLDDLQAGPILFIWGCKALGMLFNYSEVALRSTTWITCILTLPLFYHIVCELTKNKIIGLLSFLIFSVNLSLIYFSSEVKPYGIDVSVYLLITYFSVSSHGYVSRNRHLLLAIGGVLSLLLSNVTFVVMASAGLYMFRNWYMRRKVDVRDIYVLIIWGVVFLANYFTFIHNHPSTYWQRVNYTFTFAPLESFRAFVDFAAARSTEIFYSMMLYIWDKTVFSYILALIIAFATARMIFKKQVTLFIFSWLPIIAHLTLSAFHLYPFWFRLILYLVPCFIIIIAYGTYHIALLLTQRLHLAAGTLFLAGCTLFYTKENIQRFPLDDRNVKPALKFINDNMSPGRHLYVSMQANIYNYYRYRGIVKDSIYNYIDTYTWPSEFYYKVKDERKNYVFFYNEIDNAAVIEDLRRQGLIIQDFKAGGYTAAVVKPLFEEPVYKYIDMPAVFPFFPDWTALCIYSGYAESKPINLPPGKYIMYMAAQGSPSDGIYPSNSVYVNGAKIGTFTARELPMITEPMPFSLAGNTISLKINLDNDGSSEREDRNTFVKQIWLFKVE